MKNWIRTRKIMAKIDREEDIYVIADRLNQAIRDLDGNQEGFDERLTALEREKVGFQTESGVHRIISATANKEAVNWGKWAVRGTLGAATAAIAGWILNLAWRGFHVGN